MRMKVPFILHIGLGQGTVNVEALNLKRYQSHMYVVFLSDCTEKISDRFIHCIKRF